MTPKSQLSMTPKSELSMTSESTNENTHPKTTSSVVDSTSSPYNEASRGFNSKEKRAPEKVYQYYCLIIKKIVSKKL